MSPVPNLVIAGRVLTRISTAARQHIEDETGEALVGLVVPGEAGIETLYVLDTISPDDTALRDYHTFQQGDARQDELMWWLQENWRAARRLLSPAQRRFDVPLRYLGDWHKQPGAMIAPSGGDLMTALDWLGDPANHADFLLAPIVTLIDTGDVAVPPPGAPWLTIPTGGDTALRVDFWYIDSERRDFVPIAPASYGDAHLPELAPYPWHLLDEARFNAEVRRIEEAGYFVSLTLWDADGAPPLEVCLLAGRVGSDMLILLVTPYDFPLHPPTVRLAPLVPMHGDMDMYQVFANAWAASRPGVAQWDAEAGLIGILRAVDSGAPLQIDPYEDLP
jgi:hypothetical protein